MRVESMLHGEYRCALEMRERYIKWHRNIFVKILLLPSLPIYGLCLLMINLLVLIYGKSIQIMEGANHDSKRLLSTLANLYIKLIDSLNMIYLDREFYQSYIRFSYLTWNLCIVIILLIEFIFFR